MKRNYTWTLIVIAIMDVETENGNFEFSCGSVCAR